MKIGLLLNSNNRLCYYSEKYEEILKKNTISYRMIDPNSPTLFEDIGSCSHLIFRHSQGDTDKLIYDSIYPIAQHMLNVSCCPNYETYWPYEDKIREYYLLHVHHFPVIESNIFWNYEQAANWISHADFPMVAKLSKGAGSNNVVIVHSQKDAIKIFKQVFEKGLKSSGLKSKSNLSSFSKMGALKYGRLALKTHLIKAGLWRAKADYPEWQIQKDAILFQKFLPNNNFDTRVTIIGQRALAYRRFVRKNDFRASGSGNFSVDPENIDKRCIQIAFAVSKKLNFQTMAYDFIMDETHDPKISEISYCFVDWMVQACPGFWDADLVWHEGQNWPQYYQLADFLMGKKLINI